MRLVKHPYAVQVMDFEAGRLTMLGLTIDKDCKNLNGHPLGQIARNNSHFRFSVIAVLRGQKQLFLRQNLLFKKEILGILLLKQKIFKISWIYYVREVTTTKRVMIVGGSKIGRSLAQSLPSESS